MKKKSNDIFDDIVEGLEQSVAYSQGKISLKTTALPEPPPAPKPSHIVSLRNRFNMSQAVFAAALNVSIKTVQAWEQGARTPSHASLRLLQIFEDEPKILARITNSPVGVRPNQAQ